jgi:hypothetical protein
VQARGAAVVGAVVIGAQHCYNLALGNGVSGLKLGSHHPQERPCLRRNALRPTGRVVRGCEEIVGAKRGVQVLRTRRAQLGPETSCETSLSMFERNFAGFNIPEGQWFRIRGGFHQRVRRTCRYFFRRLRQASQ